MALQRNDSMGEKICGMTIAMTREEEIRISILNEAINCQSGTALGYHSDPLASKIALELIEEGLVIGDLSSSGMPFITGIRDSGLEYLESKKFHKRAISRLKKMGLAVCALALVTLGYLLKYILDLDSVKQFFSDLVGKYIP